MLLLWISFAIYVSCLPCCNVCSLSLAVTCWEKANLLALWHVMLSCVFSFPNVVSWVRCGTWLYRFLIFAFFLTWTYKEAEDTSDSSFTLSGWVVTRFLLGYTVRMFEYTVRTFGSNVGRFLYVFSSIPRKLYTIFQPTSSPIKRYQDSIFKLLTLSTNSATNVVRTAYFQIQARSLPLKNLWQSLYSK